MCSNKVRTFATIQDYWKADYYITGKATFGEIHFEVILAIAIMPPNAFYFKAFRP
jgi:hypothetical protein